MQVSVGIQYNRPQYPISAAALYLRKAGDRWDAIVSTRAWLISPAGNGRRQRKAEDFPWDEDGAFEGFDEAKRGPENSPEVRADGRPGAGREDGVAGITVAAAAVSHVLDGVELPGAGAPQSFSHAALARRELVRVAVLLAAAASECRRNTPPALGPGNANNCLSSPPTPARSAINNNILALHHLPLTSAFHPAPALQRLLTTSTRDILSVSSDDTGQSSPTRS